MCYPSCNMKGLQMAKLKKMAPFSYEALADELGDLKAELCKLQEREHVIKELLSCSGKDLVRGNRYQAAISHGERVTLAAERVRALLTPEQIRSCEKVTPFVTVRCSALT